MAELQRRQMERQLVEEYPHVSAEQIRHVVQFSGSSLETCRQELGRIGLSGSRLCMQSGDHLAPGQQSSGGSSPLGACSQAGSRERLVQRQHSGPRALQLDIDNLPSDQQMQQYLQNSPLQHDAHIEQQRKGLQQLQYQMQRSSTERQSLELRLRLYKELLQSLQACTNQQHPNCPDALAAQLRHEIQRCERSQLPLPQPQQQQQQQQQQQHTHRPYQHQVSSPPVPPRAHPRQLDPPRSAPQTPLAPQQWQCHKCTFANHEDLRECEICGTPRVAAGQAHPFCLGDACVCHRAAEAPGQQTQQQPQPQQQQQQQSPQPRR